MTKPSWMSDCNDMAKLQEEEMNHEPIMKPEYYDIPEELQDRLTYSEGKAYESQEEKDWYKDWHKRFYDHLITCNHPDCAETLNNHLEAGFLIFNKEDGTYTPSEDDND